MTRPRKVALQELGLDVTQVLSDESNLRCVGGVLGDHTLSPALGGLGEDMRRGLEAERHHVCAQFGNLRLAAARRQRARQVAR